MQNYWVTFANTSYDAKRLDVQRLDYPLVMHVPFLAFSTDKMVRVSKKTDTFEIGVELAVRICKDIFQQPKQAARDVIESYHLAISATNKYHINGIKSRVVTPSDQDEADSEYFTRWWESGNSISPKIDCDWGNLTGKEIGLTGDGFHKKGLVEYYHSPADIIHFISNLNKLVKGTYICIGHILRHELPVNASDQMPVKAILPTIAEHQVKLRIIQ